MGNRGSFRKGPDPRRHQFSREECSRGGSQETCHRLTDEDRSKGGHAAFARTVADLRMEMRLPLPDDEAVLAAARKLIEERKLRLANLPKKQRQAEEAEIGRLEEEYDIPF